MPVCFPTSRRQQTPSWEAVHSEQLLWNRRRNEGGHFRGAWRGGLAFREANPHDLLLTPAPFLN